MRWKHEFTWILVLRLCHSTRCVYTFQRVDDNTVSMKLYVCMKSKNFSISTMECRRVKNLYVFVWITCNFLHSASICLIVCMRKVLDAEQDDDSSSKIIFHRIATLEFNEIFQNNPIIVLNHTLSRWMWVLEYVYVCGHFSISIVQRNSFKSIRPIFN